MGLQVSSSNKAKRKKAKMAGKIKAQYPVLFGANGKKELSFDRFQTYLQSVAAHAVHFVPRPAAGTPGSCGLTLPAAPQLREDLLTLEFEAMSPDSKGLIWV
jgi:hypothetical protein